MAKRYVPKHGKRSKGVDFKPVVLILALMLLLGGVVGGTVAWLIATPEPVVNTFTYGDINIELNETDTGLDGDGNAATNRYEMLPGRSILKDPVVTVKAGSEDMWLFVQLKKSDNFDTFMEYTVDSGWTLLGGADGVYYRQVSKDEVKDADAAFTVLAENTVTVKETVTKAQLNALDAGGNADYPTLTVTAYAVQYAGSDTAALAWEKITETT